MFGYLCEVNKNALKHLAVYLFFKSDTEHGDSEAERILNFKQIKKQR